MASSDKRLGNGGIAQAEQTADAQNWCPFCKGSEKVPKDYIVMKYDNDFPALSQNPPIPDNVATDLYKTAPLYGKCEVILYSSDHHATLPRWTICI